MLQLWQVNCPCNRSASHFGSFVAVAHQGGVLIEFIGSTLNLATFSGTSAKDQLPWYVLQCWVRKESMIATQLESQGFECFLPKYKSIREWSDRKKEVEQPLFPGYVFCRFEYTQRRPRS